MKTKPWSALLIAAVIGVFAPSLIAQPAGDAPRPSDVRTAVSKLVMQIQQKLQGLGAQKPTEAAFAEELSQFDKIITDHPKADPNDLAMALVMKSGLYAEVLNDFDKAGDIVRRMKADYPKTEAASHADEMLKQLDQFRSMKAINDALQPGKEFPDFSVTDTTGKPLSLSQFKGKVVLIDFWATWCPPCVNEVPHVLAAYQKYHDKGFEVVGISGDQEKSELLKFVEKNKMPWPQYFDGDKPGASLLTKYGIEKFPTTYLVGADGKIVATDLRGAELEKQLEKLLK